VPHFQVEEPRRNSQPGLKIVLGIVFLAILAGTGSVVEAACWPAYQVQPILYQVKLFSSAQPLENPASATQDVSPDKGDGLTAVTDIRHWSSATSSTVVIDLQGNVQYEEHQLSGPDRIYFDLPETALDHKLVGRFWK